MVIVPGRWSSSDLRYQAAHAATMLANNAGFNCLTARVLITAAAGAAAIHAAFLERPPQRQAAGERR